MRFLSVLQCKRPSLIGRLSQWMSLYEPKQYSIWSKTWLVILLWKKGSSKEASIQDHQCWLVQKLHCIKLFKMKMMHLNSSNREMIKLDPQIFHCPVAVQLKDYRKLDCSGVLCGWGMCRLYAQRQACLLYENVVYMLPRRILKWQWPRLWRRRPIRTCLWRSFGSSWSQLAVWNILSDSSRCTWI